MKVQEEEKEFSSGEDSGKGSVVGSVGGADDE